jgi:hypothetical protein
MKTMTEAEQLAQITLEQRTRNIQKHMDTIVNLALDRSKDLEPMLQGASVDTRTTFLGALVASYSNLWAGLGIEHSIGELAPEIMEEQMDTLNTELSSIKDAINNIQIDTDHK